jgi:capsular exopolysaccharide synthesis family protein
MENSPSRPQPEHIALPAPLDAAESAERVRTVSSVSTFSHGPGIRPPFGPHPAVPVWSDATVMLLGLQRRWRLALILGILAGAGASAVAWGQIPTKCTAFALLRIAAEEPRIAFTTAEARADFVTYRDTQVTLMRSQFVLNAALRKPELSSLELIRAQPYPLHWLEGAIKVVFAGSPEIIRLEISGNDPDGLAAIINAVQEAYLEEVVNVEANQRIKRLNNLERIYQETEEKVRNKRERVRKLATSLGSGDTGALAKKEQLALEYYSLLRREHTQLRFELMREQVQLAAMQHGGVLDQSVEIPESSIEAQLAQEPELVRLQVRLMQLHQRNARFQQVVTRQDHPALLAAVAEARTAENSLESLRKTLRPVVLERLRSQRGAQAAGTIRDRQEKVAVLGKQEEILRDEVERNSAEAKLIGTSSFELEDMRDEIAQIDKVARHLADEMHVLNVELQSPPRVTRLQAAEPPRVPDLTRKTRFAGAAGFGAFALVCLVVGWSEACSRRIHSVDEVLSGLSLPVLGTLPNIPKWARSGCLVRKPSGKGYWKSALAEAIDATRTMLIRNTGMQAMRVIMVSSPLAREGKTTLAYQLANSLARAGRKAVFVDCDLRRPHGHRAFGVPLTPGFSELLRGEATLESILRAPAADGPSVIAAGEFGTDVIPLLARDELGEVFRQLKAEFEFVIVDSAPALLVTDSLLIGHHVDGVVISIRRYISRYSNVAATCDRFHMLGIPVLGAVAIGLDSGMYNYGYGTGYGGDYHNIAHVPHGA